MPLSHRSPKKGISVAAARWEVKVAPLSVFIHVKQCPLEAVLAARYHSRRRPLDTTHN